MSITEKEIFNQFTTWNKIDNLITQDVKDLVNKLDDETMVIFTGAGTSGYVGDSLVSELNKGLSRPRFYSYFSTHIVGDGDYLINKNQKILLVSFARSGNSPESIHAIKEVNEKCDHVKHLIITCNKDGALAKTKNATIILLPEETNDLGFAMTNSFSTMTIIAYKIFGGRFNSLDVIKHGKEMIKKFKYNEIISKNFDNIIYLANTGIEGITAEYLLKTNELTNGKYSYYRDHVLNFRHGPKSVITKPSLIFIIKSKNEKAKLYEEDLIKELVLDENKPNVIVIGDTAQDVLYNYNINDLSNFELMFAILPTLQLLAVKLSEQLDINPDNPSPSGSVNRVVQGVVLH